MSAAEYNFQLEQSIPSRKTVTIKNADGSPKPLTGFTAGLQLRIYNSHPDAVLTLSTDNGTITIDTATSEVTLIFSANSTLPLLYTSYVYDLILYKGDQTFKAIKGVITLSQSATKITTGAP